VGVSGKQQGLQIDRFSFELSDLGFTFCDYNGFDCNTLTNAGRLYGDHCHCRAVPNVSGISARNLRSICVVFHRLAVVEAVETFASDSLHKFRLLQNGRTDGLLLKPEVNLSSAAAFKKKTPQKSRPWSK